jgi:tetratricopeptide (TPR) repeat protein
MPRRASASWMKALFQRILRRIDRRGTASADADHDSIFDLEADRQIAREALAHNDYVGAMAGYQHILDHLPDESHALYGWGLAALRLGRDAEAMSAFRHALKSNYPHPEAGLRLAEAALARGDEADALDLYRRVLAIVPDLAEAHFGIGTVALQAGRDEEALASFRSALESKPEFAEAHFGIGTVALQAGRDEEALASFRRALESKPEFAEAHFGIGTVALHAGRDEEALASFRRALESKPEFAEAGMRLADAHFRIGVAALQAGRDGAALDAFRRAFEINPKFAEAGVRLADVALARGEAALARDVYRRVLDLAPDVPEAHYGSAIANLERGSLAEAAAALQRALALRPGYPAAIVAAAFLSLFPDRRGTRSVRAARPLICVPILPFSRDWLGGQIYLLNFASILSSLPKWKRPRLVILMLVDNWREIASLRHVVDGLLGCDAVIGMFDQDRSLISARPALERYARSKRPVPDAAANWSRDLFASVDWTFPILYPSWGGVTIPGALYWIPDLQHRFWPANFDKVELMARNRDMAALAVRPEPIIFSSHDAQSHFQLSYPQQLSRPYVWHFCTLPEPASSDDSRDAYVALKLPDRFYYTPNQFWPHKDHATLFRALRRILDAGSDITFVCTGNDLTSDTTAYSRSLVSLIEELELGANLRLLGVLPRPVQLEIMRRACAVIQPSLHEGWSTVVEDARAFGRPLIVSDLAVHREQTDGTAHFFPPQDAASLAAVVMAVDGSLPPGPDAMREAQARIDQTRRVRSSADQFMDILATEAGFRS